VSEGNFQHVVSDHRVEEDRRRGLFIHSDLAARYTYSIGLESAILLADIPAPPPNRFSFVDIHVLITDITSFTYKSKSQSEQRASNIFIQDTVGNEDMLVV
jgi:hypothetical protein